jgi:hypothetical protein
MKMNSLAFELLVLLSAVLGTVLVMAFGLPSLVAYLTVLAVVGALSWPEELP